MTKAELLHAVDEISSRQREESFILTGFYLRENDIRLLKSELTPDTPVVGAIGRLQGVPVFIFEGVRPNGEDFREAHGVAFSFVRMDCVD